MNILGYTHIQMSFGCKDTLFGATNQKKENFFYTKLITPCCASGVSGRCTSSTMF
jgi:hypothetical protein